MMMTVRPSRRVGIFGYLKILQSDLKIFRI